MRPSGTAAIARHAGIALLVAAGLTGCTSDTDPEKSSGTSNSGAVSAPTTTASESGITVDAVPRNGRPTSAQRYLGADARDYTWRDFDPVSATGLFVTRVPRDPHDDFTGLAVVRRTGPVTRLTCGRDLACAPGRHYLDYAATLGPGQDEITAVSGDRAAQVVGFDGAVRRTVDLTTTAAGGGEVVALRWSADGSRLAVVTRRDGDRRNVSRVWVVDRQGGDAELAYSLVTVQGRPRSEDVSRFDGAGAVWPHGDWGWSPDGRALLLDVYRESRRSDVVVLRLRPASASRPVVARTLYHSDRFFDSAGNVAWSPDGTRIAVRTRNHITEISANDGSVIAQHPHIGGWLIWLPRKD